jgi:fructokinase
VGFEPGHQDLDLDRSILGHRIPHTLENLVSGTALEKRRGVKPFEISQDDHVWDELAEYLAHGLKNTIVYWSPDIIVLGGSMIVGDPRILREDIERHTKALLGDFLPCPPIVDARFRDEGGLYGAMALIRQMNEAG